MEKRCDDKIIRASLAAKIAQTVLPEAAVSAQKSIRTSQ
jgi:hypothetical protein